MSKDDTFLVVNTNNTNNTGNANPPPPPPPLTMEQLVAMQTQLMQGMAHLIANMNQKNKNQN